MFLLSDGETLREFVQRAEDIASEFRVYGLESAGLCAPNREMSRAQCGTGVSWLKAALVDVICAPVFFFL